jgi:DNA-binding NtrC family response regulator
MSLRVLVVDDEEELVSALQERLNLRGFQTSGATTGEAALEHLAAEPVDIVLLDLKMPGLGGLEVLRRVRENHPRVEIILFTGHGSQSSVDEGMELGAFDYLMKPVKISSLLRVLAAAGEKKARAEERERSE